MKKKKLMTVLKSLKFVLAVSLTVLLQVGCKNESTRESVKVNSSHNSTIVFSGRVLTVDNNPIESAEVNVSGLKGVTDSKGYFEIKIERGFKYLQERYKGLGFVFPVKNNGNQYVLNIRKKGFGLMSKVYQSGVEDGIWRMTKATVENVDPTGDIYVKDLRSLVQINCVSPLSSQVDWSNYSHLRFPNDVSDEMRDAIDFIENYTICNPGISINIPANSLVDEEGNSPQGNVDVALSTVDIYDPYSMPGDYTVNVNGRYRYMETYGAGTINITSKGKSYQLKKGALAILRIPINHSQLKFSKNLLSEIPLLLYDENQGVWEVRGVAKLSEAKDSYVAQIDHFSAFNMDLIKSGQSCIKIDASGINGNFDLEVTVPMLGSDPIVRTYSISDNTYQNIHVVYNLPSNRDVLLRAFSQDLFPSPITESITVNTGSPQDPSSPNCPDFPYGACNSNVTLFEYSDVPILQGFSNSNGEVTLSWSYQFTGLGSTQDGYSLEESTVSASDGFNEIHSTVNNNDQSSSGQITFDRSNGNYWYRIRANDNGVYTSYSNVVSINVEVTTSSTPSTLRIINDLADYVDPYSIDWGKYNKIIRVRIGPTQESVRDNVLLEVLNPFDFPTDLSYCNIIAPSYANDNSYKDFDVASSSCGVDGYYIFIQTGWWEAYYDPFTYDFMYWTIHPASVMNCVGDVVYYNKWTVIHVIQPYGNPEIIKASDFLPHMHWYGTNFCN